MFKCLKEILTREKMKLELECKIFLLKHSKSFMLQFGFRYEAWRCVESSSNVDAIKGESNFGHLLVRSVITFTWASTNVTHA
jgi:hypothetical protein